MIHKNSDGFTLAELLIVVAIIAVLVAVSIPIFTRQLEKAREATDMANMRAAKAAFITAYLNGNFDESDSDVNCYFILSFLDKEFVSNKNNEKMREA